MTGTGDPDTFRCCFRQAAFVSRVSYGRYAVPNSFFRLRANLTIPTELQLGVIIRRRREVAGRRPSPPEASVTESGNACAVRRTPSPLPSSMTEHALHDTTDRRQRLY